MTRSPVQLGGILRQHLLQAALGSLFLTVLSKALMLATSVILARLLGAEGYGVYAIVIAMATILTVPTGLGLPTLLIRLLASYKVREEWGLMRGLMVRGNQAVLAFSLLLFAVATLFVWSLESDRYFVITSVLALILVPLTALSAMRSAALRGLHHVILGQTPESVVMPLLFLGAVGAWWLSFSSPRDFSPQAAVGLRVIATGAAFLLGAAILVRRIPAEVRHAQPQYEVRYWFRSAMPLLVIATLNVAMMHVDVLMLGALQSPASAGVYQAAARGAELVAFSLSIVNIAIQPSVARLYAARDFNRLQRVATLGARAAVCIALPLVAILIFIGEPLMSRVFGPEFRAGAIALVVLSLAHLLSAAAGPAGTLLNMTGHERQSAIAIAFGAITNVALNYLLIPIWGINGAAMATGISLVVCSVVLTLFVRKALGFNATAIGPSFLHRK